MAFRVLIVGARHFTDYPLLRATLDALLANRLPDVELLTTGGPGVPMLAASYATQRGLKVVALVPDFYRFPVDAVERRDAFLVTEADAAVVVGRAHPKPTARAGAGRTEGDSASCHRWTTEGEGAAGSQPGTAGSKGTGG